MSEKYPLASGDWSNAANWNGGTKPNPADDVYLNNKTLTIDESVTVNSIRDQAGATAVVGGTASTSGSVTINITDKIYGSQTSSGFLILNSGATLNGDTGSSVISGRYMVRVNEGAVMNGDALGNGGVNIDGGVMYGNADNRTGVLNSPAVSVVNSGVMNGDSFSHASSSRLGVTVGTNGTHIGDSYGGSISGTQCLNGGCHLGNSYGSGTSSGPGSDIRSGGVHIGNATGGAGNGADGTRIGTGGLFFGSATAGTGLAAHGVSMDSGFAQVTVATGEVAGSYGVEATGLATVLIASEVGDYAKTLDATVLTTNEKYPFLGSGSGGGGNPLKAFQHGLHIGRLGAV